MNLERRISRRGFTREATAAAGGLTAALVLGPAIAAARTLEEAGTGRLAIATGANTPKRLYIKSGVEVDFAELSKMNSSIVRVFVPDVGMSDDEAAQKLSSYLSEAAKYGISVIPTLMDFYKDKGAYAAGLGHFYTGTFAASYGPVPTLGHDFFAGGYKDRFWEFVTTIVTANKDHPNIYAWEPGNEFKDEDNPDSLIKFMAETTAYIKSLDPGRNIASGMISSFKSKIEPASFYPSLPDMDIITAHVYDNVEGSEGHVDAAWAVEHGRQAIIEEIGFSGSNRAQKLRDALTSAVERGMSAVLISAFIPWGLPDNHSGNPQYGMDTIWHTKEDYSSLFSTMKDFGRRHTAR